MCQWQLPRMLLAGLSGGSLVGLLVGAYLASVSVDYVIRRDDYSHPLIYEQAQRRYVATVALLFLAVFALVGPVFAAASYGPWLRHMVYGFLGGIVTVVALALFCAALTNQQPFNAYKGSHSTCIDIARIYGISVATVIGSVIGILVGRRTSVANRL